MIVANSFNGKNVALFGLGVSGCAVAKSLILGGAKVAAWDDASGAREAAVAQGIELTDLTQNDWQDFDALVLAPGVPLTHPKPHWTVERASAANIEIIGDCELFIRALADAGVRNNLIAITGTNGKSTTTVLLAHVLREAGLKVEIGGNIGTPVLELAPPADDVFYVVEFSSYQIDLTPSLAPHVAILLNISADHLDRHGTLEHYAAVKARIFDKQDAGDLSICGMDDEVSRSIAAQIGSDRVQEIAASMHVAKGVFAEDGVLYEALGGEVTRVGDIGSIGSLRGEHNWQNAAAVYAAARGLGVDAAVILRGLASFPGLAHRMEQVGDFNNVSFINDSKATNADAAARALACFDKIYWIAGGRAKEGGIDALKPYFGRMAKAYLIGEAADMFAEVLDGHVPVDQAGDIETAVAHATRDALADTGSTGVVLFSPACASFDQYRNFEVRGDAFKAAVSEITNAGGSS